MVGDPIIAFIALGVASGCEHIMPAYIIVDNGQDGLSAIGHQLIPHLWLDAPDVDPGVRWGKVMSKIGNIEGPEVPALATFQVHYADILTCTHVHLPAVSSGDDDNSSLWVSLRRHLSLLRDFGS
jgi:hypothetical protein